MNTKEFVQDTVGRALAGYDERFAAVATSGSYNDLSDTPPQGEDIQPITNAEIDEIIYG